MISQSKRRFRNNSITILVKKSSSFTLSIVGGGSSGGPTVHSFLWCRSTADIQVFCGTLVQKNSKSIEKSQFFSTACYSLPYLYSTVYCAGKYSSFCYSQSSHASLVAEKSLDTSKALQIPDPKRSVVRSTEQTRLSWSTQHG